VSVLLGDGSGAFGVATTIAVGRGPNSVAVGGFNGDGKPDLATANYSHSSVGRHVSVRLVDLRVRTPTRLDVSHPGPVHNARRTHAGIDVVASRLER
jgi:FG-GAP repeat